MDPVGFGLRYRAMHADEQEWEDWKAAYPDAGIRADVQVTLEGSGLID
ncbi:hypothetical protein XYCOK13_18140 [Xylanibacillus composti]|uniref:Spore germination GerAC-like C-terminal domain-containing protein n=2 Tax=Xylanibacillus composti TaxID=1572762 RepID=A0A8J4M2C8_9BACL|nr:hypothetical protein XYCOK13_18140 [Xylanibacillus composti]